jgi:tryptophan synthase alpha chain
MSRLSDTIRKAASSGRKAMGLFVTGGFPTPGDTVPILRAIDRGGADFIELGMPFSDPLAEGLPIQHSSERALAAGASMRGTIRAAAEFRAGSETPLVLMGYVNPVLRYGPERFFHDAREAGVDGVILPDLPPEERDLLAGHASACGIDLVHLIAPTTPDDRIRRIDEVSSGFVYAVSITGLTGTGLGPVDAVESYLERARRLVVRNPLLVGFGIGSAEDAARLSRHTDGFIVGSALIRRIEALWDDDRAGGEERLEAVAAFVLGLRP